MPIEKSFPSLCFVETKNDKILWKEICDVGVKAEIRAEINKQVKKKRKKMGERKEGRKENLEIRGRLTPRKSGQGRRENKHQI